MKFWLWTSVLLITACDGLQNPSSPNGFIKELPEAVLEIAAPYQNLNAVRINPTDGCFVYLHDGPVESTLLPLRSKSGRPICTQVADATEEV
ncbi:MAG: hypothetical protein ABJ327_11200 [Litoreibacter sp.]